MVLYSMVVACTVFTLSLGAALLGMLLHIRLPDHHLSTNSLDSIKLVMGLVGTVTALVLGLLISSAKYSYDTQSNGMVSLSANIIALDRTLELYGPEASEAREALRTIVQSVHQHIWDDKASSKEALSPILEKSQADRFLTTILKLDARDNTQRFLKDRALQLTAQTGQLRLLLFQQSS